MNPLSRRTFGWDLPPGCSHRDIEKHFGDDEMEAEEERRERLAEEKAEDKADRAREEE